MIDGKFSSFAKINVRLSRQSNIELSPSRTISSFQYQRLIEVNLLINFNTLLFFFFKESQLNLHSYYTLKVHFKRHSIQDYVMTSIPMVT